LGIKKGSQGIRLALKVTPNAGRNEIIGYKDGVLHIKVAVAPEKGKANKHIGVKTEGGQGPPLSF
jgi:uncharacterized protein YggU (UPF0235/DUF167 family)